MRNRLKWLGLLTVCGCAPLVASGVEIDLVVPADESIRFGFSIENDRYVVGEPMWAQATVSNGSPQEIWLAIQYRPDNSYRFFVEDNAAERLDPYYYMGGFFEKEPVPPGGVHVRRILLSSYLRFNRPGTFCVWCMPTFPIETPDGKRWIEGRFGDEVEMVRDDEKLRKIVAGLEGGLDARDWEARENAIRQLVVVRHPLALAPLQRVLADSDRSHVQSALEGIAGTEGAEAWDILTDFVRRQGNTRIGQYARRLLERRDAAAAAPPVD
ncbi:MAG: HEAT repeat domain-containing protein [Opitutae bacterium]|nr:HEAT repeat domain-containing protein [Opitutae bacterium]